MPSANRRQRFFTAREIKSHCDHLKGAFEPFLENISGVRGDPKWESKIQGKQIEFLLHGRDQYVGWRSDAKATCPVVRANRTNDAWDGASVWVSLREKWEKKRPDSFVVKEAGFTFFWGRHPYTEPLRRQVCRAEWAQKAEGEKMKLCGSEYAAHPHWHIDLPPSVANFDVTGIHLGMAGWDNDGDAPFGCWQRFVESDLGVLELWEARTVEYAIEQIVRFFAAEDAEEGAGTV